MRLEQHRTGFFHDSFTTIATDWELYFYLKCENRSMAVKVEAHIKKMKSRIYIENLKLYPEMQEKLITKFK